MNGTSTGIVTRFAPSPTGHLHIGGARTALFCWAYARGHGGRFLLRIEDTDQARSSDEATQGILRDLLWLGIDWDDGPTFTAEDGRTIGGDERDVGPFQQSQRRAIYDEHLQRLIDQDKAYYAFESPEEIEIERKTARAAKKPYRYNRAALSISADERLKRVEAGEPCVVRFKTPDEPIVVHDEALGEVTVAAGEIDDFIIRKRDGFPTYHFAVVIDDELMGVSHVIRGQEHLANTPRHVAMQRALGFRTPVYAHLTLIFNADGSKMSKRDKDKAARQACKTASVTSSPVDSIDDEALAKWLKDSRSQLATDQLEALAEHLRVELPEINVDDFRAAGYLPEVVCNAISLIGWSPGDDIEKFDNAFLAEKFDFNRLGKTNAKFDRKKLLAFSADAFAAMDDGDFEKRWRSWCERESPKTPASLSDEAFATLAAALRPRVKTFREAARSAAFALTKTDEIQYNTKAVEKTLLKNDGEGLAALEAVRLALEALPCFEQEAAHEALARCATEREVGLGKVAQPIRVALTGSTVSPPIDATLAVLGKAEALARIDRCLAEFGSVRKHAGD